MPDEVLSQSEVESLLSAVDTTPVAAAKAESPHHDSPPSFGVGPRDRVSLYDFKRPERVGKEQMRALQSLHEGFGRNFGAALSGLLRSVTEVRLTSVDQLTYGEFVFSLENPTCLNVIRAEPLEGNLILDINPSVLYPIIDRLLGGGKETGPPARRPLTEIELRLVNRVTQLFLDELKRAWRNVLELALAVDRVESSPQLVQIVPPNEVVVLISFELAMGETRGMLNLCIPFNSIERIANKLTANSWASFSTARPTPASIDAISGQLHGSVVELVVTLAETKITTADLIGLRVGDVITTDKDVHETLPVAVQGVAKFRALAGALKGYKAFRVE